MPDTFSFEEAQPETFSFEAARYDPHDPETYPEINVPWYKMPGEDLGPWNRPKEEALEEARQIALPALYGKAVEAVGKGAVQLADIPTRLANIGKEKYGPGYVLPLEDIPRPKLPRIPEGALQPGVVDVTSPTAVSIPGKEEIATGLGNLAIGTAESLLPPYAAPEIGLTAPALGGRGLVGKLAASAYAGSIGVGLPQQISDAIEVLTDPESTKAQKTEALGNPIVQTAFGILMARHAGKVTRADLAAEVAYQLKKAAMEPPTPTAPTPERRLGIGPVPTTPFEQPGIVELADAALRERQQLVRPAGEQGQPALGALRIAVGGEPMVVTPELPPAPAVRIPGGGEAPYGKVSYRREAEAPLPERTIAATAAERQMLEAFEREEADAGRLLPKRKLPPAGPSLATKRGQLEAGMQQASGYYLDELGQPAPGPEAPPAETQASTIITTSNRPKPLVKPTVLSGLQRARLRLALERGAPEQVILNILRMGEREPAQPQRRKAPPQILAQTVAQAGETLPAAAAEAEKGVTANAPEKRNVQEGVLGERPGDDAQRTPAETGVGGGVRPAAPSAAEEVPRATGEQGRVLLKPDMESARRVAAMTPDEFRANAQSFNKTNLKLGQHATDAELAELRKLRDDVQARANDAKAKAQASGADADIQAYSDLGAQAQYFNEAIAEGERVRKTEPPPPVTEAAPQQPAPPVAAPEGEPVAPVSAGAPPGISQPTTPVETAQGPVAKLTFKQFLSAPREGPLLEALRSLPKPEPTADELAKSARYDRASEALDKAGLSWVYAHERSDAAIRGLSKAKQKLVKEYNDALDAKVSSTPEQREARQKALYDRAVAAGVIENPQGPTRLEAVNERLAAIAAQLKDINKGFITGKVAEDARAPLKDEQTRLFVEKQLLEKQGPVEKAASQGQTLVAGTALEKWANDQLKGGGTHLGPDVLAAYLVKGVGLMERGVIRFADWAQRMIAEHGQAITPKLRELYEEAKAAFERRAGSPAYQPARDIFERQRATAQPAQPAAASTTPQTTTPAAPRRAVTSGLDDIYKIFEAEKPQRTPIRRTASNIIEAVRTGFSSKFRPINKLAEDIAKAYGIAKQDIAGIFEQLKGSRGKGEADVYRFDRAVSDLVGKDTKDFNAYMFLNRSLDRLRADLRDLQAAQSGAPVAKLNRRSVAGYTIPELEAKLATLEAKLGPENLARFREAATRYQAAMDSALRLQVESGRMSQEVYSAIKADNQFYAPFKVMKWLEEGMRPEGSGRKVDTLADYTKAMTGIEDPNFKLGDMLSAARQNLLISRILADKATAMRKVADLATQDTQAQFIKKLGPKEEPRAGWKTVNVFENGKPVKYATNPEVVKAIELFGDRTGGFISGVLQAASIPFKAGATALNIPFQVSNLLADVPRQALVSRYGIRGVSDLIRYPLDLVASLHSSIMGDVFGRKNKLFLDFLDSGAAATTVQESLTPEALRFRDPVTMSKAKRVALNILYSPAEFAAAIESTSKIMGIKRAMRFEGAASGADLAKRIPAAVTEIRRFSGSPDFGRQGSWTETARLNLLYMFLNARIQGAIADIGRLAGRDGAKRAAITWMRLGTAIGTPTVMLYALNNSPEHRDDYAKRPVYEKENYWLIPKGSYVTNEQGEKVRDYWRVPKRESSKWIANMVESGLNFAQKRDPQALGQFLVNTLEDISPVNIQGRTAQERIESVGASLNPVIKAPLEVATQRDMFRHRPLIPDTMKKASPELQYTDRTPEAFKVLANKMPDVAPEFLRSPIMLENMTRNLTAGLITQFLPGKPVEGRSRLANIPLLQRFQAIPYTDNAAFTEEMRQMDRESADEYLTRHRKATDMLRDGKDKSLPDILRATKDPKIMQQVVDLWVARKNGVTQQDRQLIGLPPKQRAELLAKRLSKMTPEQKKAAILDWSKKRVLTKAVFMELGDAFSTQAP